MFLSQKLKKDRLCCVQISREGMKCRFGYSVIVTEAAPNSNFHILSDKLLEIWNLSLSGND